jgi:amino acid adenylation domain-containing protein
MQVGTVSQKHASKLHRIDLKPDGYIRIQNNTLKEASFSSITLDHELDCKIQSHAVLWNTSAEAIISVAYASTLSRYSDWTLFSLLVAHKRITQDTEWRCVNIQFDGETEFRQQINVLADALINSTHINNISEHMFGESAGFVVSLGIDDVPPPFLTPMRNSTTDVHLTITQKKNNETTLSLSINTALYNQASTERLLGHIVTLLKHGLDEPSKHVALLRLLTDAELQDYFYLWNDTASPYPDNICIQQWFEQIAARFPHNIALEQGAYRLSFSELNRRANQLAHHLRRNGVESGMLIGIIMERSYEMVVGILGILKAGGAYVPIDPDYPSDRVTYILDEIQAPLILTQRNVCEKHLAFRIEPLFCMNEDWQFVASEQDSNPVCYNKVDDVAYVIFTSGSTGKPKGIELQHQGLCNLIHASNTLFRVHPESRILQFAAFGFDVAVWEIFMALIAGARLYINEQSRLQSVLQLPRTLREARITMALLPPSLLNVLPNQNLPNLETIIAVGERCTNENVRRWSPVCNFFNGYGPAEGTVTVSVELTSLELPKLRQGPSIGRPLQNIHIYILDRYLQPAPIGVPGEMYLAGVCIARGYLNRPELTKEKFISNPFREYDANPTLYKTGDIACFLPDGKIEFIGRNDFLVKLYGFRIELEEVENTLEELSEIGNAVVMLTEEQGNGKSLTAYVTLNDNVNLARKQIYHYLQRKLPYYMLPSAIVILDQLPLNSNGKIDRRLLPTANSQDRINKYL